MLTLGRVLVRLQRAGWYQALCFITLHSEIYAHLSTRTAAVPCAGCWNDAPFSTLMLLKECLANDTCPTSVHLDAFCAESNRKLVSSTRFWFIHMMQSFTLVSHDPSTPFIIDYNIMYSVWHWMGQCLQLKDTSKMLQWRDYLDGLYLVRTSYMNGEVYASMWHGLLWQYLSDVKTPRQFWESVRTLCNVTDVTNVLRSVGCAHGVGHGAFYYVLGKAAPLQGLVPGTMAEKNFHLSLGLQLCEEGSPPFAVVMCKDGLAHSLSFYTSKLGWDGAHAGASRPSDKAERLSWTQGILQRTTRVPPISIGISSCDAIYNFIISGGRGIDTALIYSRESKRAIACALSRASSAGSQRSDIFITGKIYCCPSANLFAKPLCERLGLSEVDAHTQTLRLLKEIGADTLDLLLVHWPCASHSATVAFYKDAERLMPVHTKRLGVSNFDSQRLNALVRAVSVVPVVNQVAFSIGMRDTFWGRDLRTRHACRELNMTYAAYAPLGLSTGFNVLEDPVVQSIASSLQRTPAQVALRWVWQQGLPLVTKTSKISHVQNTLGMLDFRLSRAHMIALHQVNLTSSHVCSEFACL